jgi:maltooligosyltrehalose trehalohydrolase
MMNFRLWAPAAKRVDLEFEDKTIPMSAEVGAAHVADVTAAPCTRYRFRVCDKSVPDPAAKQQIADWSVTTDPNATAWRDSHWRGRPWEETVLYELHVGLMGGFAKVEEHLPRLAELGITAVELMPIGQFPGERNWGYDGVLPYAPANAYGDPDDLKRMIDRAHELGMMVFLDVVYNHFGPEGNYLPLYAPEFFSEDRQTPWGAGVNFKNEHVRRFFIENALYWVKEFHIDGLRLDAIHAIADDNFIVAIANEVRDSVPDRRVHIVVEDERNKAALLDRGRMAQWNDDFHHAVHVLLTGEHEGYYEPYAAAPAAGLAHSLSGHFIEERSGPSAALAPSRFVNFLQNHDHVGNRAFGERLTVLAKDNELRGAIALLLLSPSIPMIFFGEEVGAREPFFYFCDYKNTELANAIRDGRRNEFAKFSAFKNPQKREQIPDPNDVETFLKSRPRWSGGDDWQDLYKSLLALRKKHIITRLKGTRSERAKALNERAVQASWIMGDGARLTILTNFSDDKIIPNNEPQVPPIWNQDGTRCWIEPQ